MPTLGDAALATGALQQRLLGVPCRRIILLPRIWQLRSRRLLRSPFRRRPPQARRSAFLRVAVYRGTLPASGSVDPAHPPPPTPGQPAHPHEMCRTFGPVCLDHIGALDEMDASLLFPPSPPPNNKKQWRGRIAQREKASTAKKRNCPEGRFGGCSGRHAGSSGGSSKKDSRRRPLSCAAEPASLHSHRSPDQRFRGDPPRGCRSWLRFGRNRVQRIRARGFRQPRRPPPGG